MAEPQPSSVHEGADLDGDGPVVPTNAEDRKAAQAMSTLEGKGEEDEGKHRKEVDTEALGKAMKNLNVKDDASKKADEKKKVKVEAADVTLLIDQLELSKVKATDLLKAHEGDAVKAMTAYVMAAV